MKFGCRSTLSCARFCIAKIIHLLAVPQCALERSCPQVVVKVVNSQHDHHGCKLKIAAACVKVARRTVAF